MFRIILSRLTQGVLVLFVLLTLTFFLVRQLPGSPFQSERQLAPHIEAKLNETYGLDKPVHIQYVNYLKSVAKGDLMPSMKRETREVSEIIGQAFPVSATLGVCAMAIAVGIGIPAGVIAAVRRNSFADYAAMVGALVGICVPTFVIGPLLATYFGINLGWFRVAGWGQPGDLVLPALTLALPTAAYIARLTRSGMLEVMSQDFIRTARAKGLPESTIIVRHALRGGLVPVVAFLGPAFAAIISGSFVIESIFQIPGMGQHFVQAPGDRDYTLLQGIVLLFGVLIVAANILSDLATLWLNPRARTADNK
ncbi:ABC transporter permease [Sulfuriroseicoccus oceanibius]|uniref:ABC transporter permease n=1 Tax=Sulfuriroseicoccus oceanibius TaxID=2707525 RepID=A0A6B3LFP6_9BACT|nr:ABC transporter permease [Sulfuriroseicoccus oceanibius]QQL44750.1 ABC transporter permease [Sulfuriroseicoccus oceanibius]